MQYRTFGRTGWQVSDIGYGNGYMWLLYLYEHFGGTKATRMELRCPDPACNPYLTFAALLQAGLEGIEKG